MPVVSVPSLACASRTLPYLQRSPMSRPLALWPGVAGSPSSSFLSRVCIPFVLDLRASKLCGEFAMTLTGNYDTSPVKFGIKVKNFLIKGLECKQNRIGQKVYVLEPHVAIASLIEKRVIGDDWNLATL